MVVPQPGTRPGRSTEQGYYGTTRGPCSTKAGGASGSSSDPINRQSFHWGRRRGGHACPVRLLRSIAKVTAMREAGRGWD